MTIRQVLSGLVISTTLVAAPANLSQTGLYDDIQQKTVSAKALTYSPQYPLWSDGAKKTRWLMLPDGKQIDGADADHWAFPVGTKVWKEFAFNDANGVSHRVETRYIEKLPNGKWDFTTYLWTADEKEAALATTAGIKNYYAITAEKKHDIPSKLDCQRCHRTGGDALLGIDPLQLSTDRDPLAPHAEALPEGALTLKSLVDKNLLVNVDAELLSHPPRIEAATPEGRAAMGYMHSNCGSCHNPEGSDTSSEMFLRYPGKPVAQDDSPVFKTAVGKNNVLFALPGEETSVRIKPGDAEHSTFVFRMKALTPIQRMPAIGTKLLDDKAIALLTQWINQL